MKSGRTQFKSQKCNNHLILPTDYGLIQCTFAFALIVPDPENIL
jgi:hypothetical protein